jgi:hypothetical protein
VAYILPESISEMYSPSPACKLVRSLASPGGLVCPITINDLALTSAFSNKDNLTKATMDYESHWYYKSAMGLAVPCREGAWRDISPSEGPAA